MIPFRILLIPLTLLSGLFKPKKHDIIVRIKFFRVMCYVSHELSGERYSQEEALTGAFVYYLARYFHLCDRRQRSNMLKAFRPLFKDYEIDFNVAFDKINSTTFSTLSDREKDAATRLFATPTPMFPMFLADSSFDNTVPAPYGEYIYTAEFSAPARTHLKLSPGADIILYPLSVLHIYQYVHNMLKSDSIKRLNVAANHVLDSMESDPRGNGWQEAIPHQALKKAGIHFD